MWAREVNQVIMATRSKTLAVDSTLKLKPLPMITQFIHRTIIMQNDKILINLLHSKSVLHCIHIYAMHGSVWPLS
jgi:hypothetical protein